MTNLTVETTRLRAEWWPPDAEDEQLQQGDSSCLAYLEVDDESGDTNLVTFHTYVDGRGSLSSYTFDREEARRFALRLLIAAEV